PFIDRRATGDAFRRAAAAWSLGEIGSPRAARPLAGLLLRELSTVERSGYLDHGGVVRAVSVAIRRIGGVEALYALVKALCVLARARGVQEETVAEIVDSLAEVGGPSAVREAADRFVQSVGERPPEAGGSGLDTVGEIIFERLSLCGDSAQFNLKRIALGGPPALRPIAERILAKF
ncbi:MAG: HEAT repeat domain-containing protein, partial [Planctomycetota bacterium]